MKHCMKSFFGNKVVVVVVVVVVNEVRYVWDLMVLIYQGTCCRDISNRAIVSLQHLPAILHCDFILVKCATSPFASDHL